MRNAKALQLLAVLGIALQSPANPVPAGAQSDRGDITGRVSDPAIGDRPGAIVVARQRRDGH